MATCAVSHQNPPNQTRMHSTLFHLTLTHRSKTLFLILEDISSFDGATDTPFWISGDVCPSFENQGGSLVCFLTCVILRFTSRATPADCLAKPIRLQWCHLQDSNPKMLT